RRDTVKTGRGTTSKVWTLGVVKESVNKHMGFPPTPKDGAWTLSARYTGWAVQYFACDSEILLLHVRQTPKTVGVFVDCEKGEVSFYDVDTRTLMYSFTGCTFTEKPSTLKYRGDDITKKQDYTLRHK
uniref:B30.2/SPRY domain-containing protein n=1 Tax=Haplochromis burtoni TaxID=8153 RepID=A0A3Q2VAD7_HAPBU